MLAAPASHNVSFHCPDCQRALTPPYAPPTVLNCPSCGTKMTPRPQGTKPHVQCPKCHTVSDAYVSDRCPKCGGAWQAFTSTTTSAQSPEAAFKHGVKAQSGPTANNLGLGAK